MDKELAQIDEDEKNEEPNIFRLLDNGSFRIKCSVTSLREIPRIAKLVRNDENADNAENDENIMRTILSKITE